MFVETKFFHKAGEGSGGGGGGSDPHNLGYYADLTALQTAHPTGTNGDFAILGSTDTIWVWDSGTSAWKDTDTKGQVTSVNGQTGAVVLTASDVGAATSAQGAKADTAVQPGDLATVATTGAYSDLTGTPTIPAAIQVSTIPTAAADELDKIYQFIGTTDANYTNGYFYKCVSDGQDPATYSWTQTDVQPSSGGQTIQYDTMPTASAETVGKIVQYIGTTDSTYTQGCFYRGNSYQSGGQTYYNWFYTSPAQNVSATNAVFVGKDSGITSGYSNYNIAIGSNAKAASYSIAIGQNSYNDGGSVAIGEGARATKSGAIKIGNGDSTRLASGQEAVAIGSYASATGAFGVAVGSSTASANYAIQLGFGTNSTANTFSVGLSYSNNYRLLDADGTIPKERLTNVVATPSTAPVLAVADWSSNTQTITVTGVTATNTVFVAPAPASAADYAAAGILCTAQGSGTLTFTCTTVPSNAITVNVVILG